MSFLPVASSYAQHRGFQGNIALIELSVEDMLTPGAGRLPHIIPSAQCQKLLTLLVQQWPVVALT